MGTEAAITLRYSEKLLLRHAIKQLQEHYMEVLNSAAKSKRSKGKKDKKTSDDDAGADKYRTNPAWASKKAKDEV